MIHTHIFWLSIWHLFWHLWHTWHMFGDVLHWIGTLTCQVGNKQVRAISSPAFVEVAPHWQLMKNLMCLDAMYPSCIGLGHNSSNSCLVRARKFIINEKMELDGKCHVHVIHHIRMMFCCFLSFSKSWGAHPIPMVPSLQSSGIARLWASSFTPCRMVSTQFSTSWSLKAWRCIRKSTRTTWSCEGFYGRDSCCVRGLKVSNIYWSGWC